MSALGLRLCKAALLLLPCALLLCAGEPGADLPETGSVNEPARRRLQSKLLWREAQPPGCKKDAPQRWCELSGDDGTIVVIRKEKRLREVATNSKAGLARRRESGGGSEDAAYANDLSAMRMMGAVQAAHKKFAKKQRGKKARVPTSYKCRKLKRKKIDGRMEDLTDKVSLLEYSCSVTGDGPKAGPAGSPDAKTKGGKEDAKSPQGKGKKGKKGKNDKSKVGCSELKRWLKAYYKAPKATSKKGAASKFGSEERPAFWKFLARDHAGYAELEKLKRHSDSAGTGTGKVRKAIEKVVVSAYRSFSRQVHTDRLPKPCKQDEELKDLAQLIFNRAAQLKECVLKPLRCEIAPLEQAKGFRHGEL